MVPERRLRLHLSVSIFFQGQLYFVIVDVDSGVDEVEQKKLDAAGKKANNQLKKRGHIFENVYPR